MTEKHTPPSPEALSGKIPEPDAAAPAPEKTSLPHGEPGPAGPSPVADGGDGAPPPKKSGGMLLKIFFVLIAAIFGAVAYVAYDAYTFLNTPASTVPQETVIDIRPGATFDRVAWDLYKAGVITDVTRFRILAKFKKQLGSVKAGEFAVNTGWKPEQVLTQITSGKAILYRLAIREGLTWWEVARLVEEGGFASAQEFEAVIHDPEFLRRHGIPFANAEGFLYPETYLLQKPRTLGGREQAENVAGILVEAFWKHSWDALKEYAATEGPQQSPPLPLPAFTLRNGFPARIPPRSAPQKNTEKKNGAGETAPAQNAASADETAPTQNAAPAGETAPAQNATAADETTSAQNAAPAGETAPARENAAPAPLLAPVSPETLRRLVTLASLVEKETGVPEERTRVAGVYANRLRIGMLLQCDPTIIYGLGKEQKGPIRRSQLDDEKNPYNTYKHPGLPPGPICSPGFAAIQAAMAPEKHAFFYFVATGGQDGTHTFSTNLRDHEKAVRVYRATQGR